MVFDKSSYNKLKNNLQLLRDNPVFDDRLDKLNLYDAKYVIGEVYNWFNEVSFDYVEILIGYSNNVSIILENIANLIGLLNIEELKKRTNSYIRDVLKKLANEFDLLRQIDANFNRQRDIKDAINGNRNNSIEATGEQLEKLKERILNLNRLCDDLYDSIGITREIYNNTVNENLGLIEKTKTTVLKEFNEYKQSLQEDCNAIIRELKTQKDNNFILYDEVQKSLTDMNVGIYRETLARYFLNERRKLKGDLDVPVLAYSLLLSLLVINASDGHLIDFKYYTIVKESLFCCAVFSIALILVEFAFMLISKKLGDNSRAKNDSCTCLRELLTPYWCWLGLTFAGMFSILRLAYKSYYIYATEIGMVDVKLILPNIPLFMILIWFTWFCSKQFSYTKQICDEYEYKYALSQSYLSYRDEAKELSKAANSDALLVALLDSVIKNIATSPVQAVKSDCHTPFTEVLGSLKGSINLKEKD